LELVRRQSADAAQERRRPSEVGKSRFGGQESPVKRRNDGANQPMGGVSDAG